MSLMERDNTLRPPRPRRHTLDHLCAHPDPTLSLSPSLSEKRHSMANPNMSGVGVPPTTDAPSTPTSAILTIPGTIGVAFPSGSSTAPIMRNPSASTSPPSSRQMHPPSAPAITTNLSFPASNPASNQNQSPITARRPNHPTNPARPSPLSRLRSSPGPDSPNTPRAGNHTYAQRQAATALAAEAAMSPNSPCFVHSHLEKYGHLDDWLRAKIGGGAPSGGGGGQRVGGGQGGGSRQRNISGEGMPNIHSITESEQEGSETNGPAARPRNASNGLNGSSSRQDRDDVSVTSSTNGSTTNTPSRTKVCAPSPSDLDDAEDGGSLTRQLAETATGVREMSKQLGRTKVRSNIQSVLIVTKARDNRLIRLTREVAVYLMRMKRSANSDRGMIVYVDAQLRTSKRFDAAGLRESNPEFFKPLHRRRSSSSASIVTLSGFMSDATNGGSRSSGKRPDEEGQLRYWTSEMCSSQPHLFDMVVTLGGDGTVLFTSWLFQRIVPPVLPFALGSLGFLTNFDFAAYAKTLDKAVDDGIRVNLRMRFTCTVYRAVAPDEDSKSCKKRKAIKSKGGDILVSQVDKEGWEALESAKHEGEKGADKAKSSKHKKDKEIMCFSTRPVETFEVLNDLVVDRGPSPYVSLLELFGDDHHLTTVQADGLCVATPTGSTAYSLSAGGSLVHPGIPALLISPICPHTLSFRPMLLPDGMELRVCVPFNSRSTAWASFDGRGRVELKQGDHIKIAASKYPFPTICADKQSSDWFNSISRTLRWNEREKQKSFVVVEEDRARPVKLKTKKRLAENAGGEDKLDDGMKGNKNTQNRAGDGKERGADDKARVEMSKKVADEGYEKIEQLGKVAGAKQEKYRSGVNKAQDEDNDDQDELGGSGSGDEEDEEDEEDEDEEEEGFDIDDVPEPEKLTSSPESEGETPPPTADQSRNASTVLTSAQPAGTSGGPPSSSKRPMYSTKRPSRLMTSLISSQNPHAYDSDGMKSGVDTPDRFAQPYNHHGDQADKHGLAKSPETFARHLDEELEGVLKKQEERRGAGKESAGQSRQNTYDSMSDSGKSLTRRSEVEEGWGKHELSGHEGDQGQRDGMFHPEVLRSKSSMIPGSSDSASSSSATVEGMTQMSEGGRPAPPVIRRRGTSTSRDRNRSATVTANNQGLTNREKSRSRSRSRSRTHHRPTPAPAFDDPTDSEASNGTFIQSRRQQHPPQNRTRSRSSGSQNRSQTRVRERVAAEEKIEEGDADEEEGSEEEGGGGDGGTTTKAFAFYGEDESESGMSDDQSEE